MSDFPNDDPVLDVLDRVSQMSDAELAVVQRHVAGRRQETVRSSRQVSRRLRPAMVACTEALGHPPQVRDYDKWRSQFGPSRQKELPHWRSFVNTFGGWRAAVEACGVDAASIRRSPYPKQKRAAA